MKNLVIKAPQPTAASVIAQSTQAPQKVVKAVRTHREKQSAALAESLGVRAFTNRKDIYFKRV